MQPSIKIALGLGTAGFALCACAAVLGIDDGHLRDGGDGGTADQDSTTLTDSSDGNPPDPGHVDGDGSVEHPDGATSGCETVDAPTDDHGVFVATDGTDGPSCGGHGAACKTVQVGINRAFDLGKGVVYVARGTYVESITLKAGITVDGGWDVVRSATDAVWSRACTSAATMIQGAPTDPVTVHAESLGGHAKLSTLSIRSKLVAEVKAGESLIGVLAASGTQLDLVAVDIQTVAGGNGASGKEGDGGAPPPASCDAGSDGAPATSPGGKGDGADGGYFNATGYVATSGTQGKPGAPGNNGIAAGKGSCVDCRTCQSGLTCEDVDAGVACGSDGTTGCGGSPGSGGGAGGGGGSSVALVAWDNARVSITASSLKAGDGGHGGAGGGGGPGVDGTGGTAGKGTASCSTQCGGLIAVGCVTTTSAGSAGTAGGTGGKGSSGGTGGDGSGGSSFAYVEGGGATVTKDGATTLAFGNAAPAVGNGAAGHAGDKGP